ncbi:peroxidase P7 [Selaginella moellendorffii]|uniref:peroxidase P7 n=1 Tax=Selaginella moellendorffii TaxID=88036 RepID=UPI000D1D0F72|nr:peroxidase P7 [Selaginella moellendorffii]|eukprot:XP_002992287.2 peroxidase P7 [Selaginella moellendorffii]
MSMVVVLLLLLPCALLCLFSCAAAQLTPDFYDKSCPTLIPTVRAVLQKAIAKEPRIAASLLRLHFHDCFVNGCDASLLLDDTPSFTGEKGAVPNNRSARGFRVVDRAKFAVEKSCPGVVSCADILAILARESVVLLDGPSWAVQLGRRDSTTANRSAANNEIPPPNSTLANLLSQFQAKGLNAQELVALSGSHTIGLSRCVSFRDRLYNFSGSGRPDSTLQPHFWEDLRAKCPRFHGNNVVAPLDAHTPLHFDNLYYHNLHASVGLLNSDQVLYSTSGPNSTRAIVTRYRDDQGAFFADFASAMVKMGNISPLTGTSGQIRKKCRRVN